MAHSRQRARRRIEIDTLFAPSPQALVLDRRVSASACRLWDVLYIFRWNDTPPDFDKLAAAMGTTERSVYRWLQELEATGWIDWDRNAALPDRFTLRTEPSGAETDTGVNFGASELTQGSIKLIPRSNKLIPRSEELTQVSISDLLDPTAEPQNDGAPSHENHEKNQKGGSRARANRAIPKSAPRHVAYLVDHEMFMAAEFAHLDPDAAIADYDARRADGQTNAAIVSCWRAKSPAPGDIYERRSTQSEPTPDRTQRSADRSRRYAETISDTPEWMAEQLAALDDDDGNV